MLITGTGIASFTPLFPNQYLDQPKGTFLLDLLKHVTRRAHVLRFWQSACIVLLLFAPATSWGADRLMIVPDAGLENGRLGVGTDLRFFAVPNFGFEVDGFWDPNECGNCSLSETTVTGSLFYWINPWSSVSFYALLGGGIGSFSLSQPFSDHADLPLFDTGAGAVFWINRHLGLDLDNRWIFVTGGGLAGNASSSLNTYRLTLGLAYAF